MLQTECPKRLSEQSELTEQDSVCEADDGGYNKNKQSLD